MPTSSVGVGGQVFDRDGADGIDLIRRWAGESCAVPLMLVSNYADAQARCVEVGGVQGFGKANLTSAATTELLGRFLESKTESEPSGQ
ncbi:MAG: hypothetical protein R3C01_15745 [Planctomycetaceae bacterium]